MVVPILQMRKSLPEVPKLRPGRAKIESIQLGSKEPALTSTMSPSPTPAQGKAENIEGMDAIHSLSVPNDPILPT